MKLFVDVIIKQPKDGAVVEETFRGNCGARGHDATGAAGREWRRPVSGSGISGSAAPQPRLGKDEMILRDGVATGSAGNLHDGRRK